MSSTAEAGVLPGHPFVHLRGQDLFVEDVALSRLAAEHGTPLFV